MCKILVVILNIKTLISNLLKFLGKQDFHNKKGRGQDYSPLKTDSGQWEGGRSGGLLTQSLILDSPFTDSNIYVIFYSV